MIEVIVGKKGSGKTKSLVDSINAAAQEAKGSLVCVEKDMNLTFEISNKVRLIAVEDYQIAGYDLFCGFIAGLLASNYDIEKIYIDGILRIVGRDYNVLSALLERLGELSAANNVDFLLTVSADKEELPEGVVKFIK